MTSPVQYLGVALAALLLSSASPTWERVTGDSSRGALSDQQLGFLSHINHIVFVVLENHAYDNYFGTYCLVKSTLCPYTGNGVPSTTCVPYNTSNLTGACARPWNFTVQNWSLSSPLPHGWVSSARSWNAGAMNGFYKAEGSGLDPFGHYNGTTAPTLWDLAEEYALDDNFYSSAMTYSLPNHWHIIAGQSPQVVFSNFTKNSTTTSANYTLKVDHTYLAQANQTTSIEDRLLHSNASWKYYDFPLGSYANATKIGLNANKSLVLTVGSAYAYFNPLAAKAESYSSGLVSHYVTSNTFYGDAKNGTLPDISWVIPPNQYSDHPPVNTTHAQDWLAGVVNAVEASPDWNTTALYVTWDDYGGFYDHVDPPTWQGQQLGFRVPTLEISAWTRPGVITAQFGYFEAILHLMEWRFKMRCISALDCNATLPLWGFSWGLKSPRAPIQFATTISQSAYPYNATWNGTASVPIGNYSPPGDLARYVDNPAADVD
ncbi:MAG: hypothetical protein L3K13_05190 [Thermoplasmata archaeon]|nr:hypothetical protein [Thermoplasmata archaeon]